MLNYQKHLSTSSTSDIEAKLNLFGFKKWVGAQKVLF